MNNAHVANVMASALASALASDAQARQRYFEAQAERDVKNGAVQGFVEVAGIGELFVGIEFPLTFAQKPLFTYGSEVAANTVLESGNFPVVSATVYRWFTVTDSTEAPFYTGATLAVCVFGPATLVSTLHYSFAGVSFSKPDASFTDLGAVL